ncbi:MAG: hypothetical protein AB7O31_03185 [Burkholderiales bacterium]
MLSQDEKLDEALKDTFPASDAFYLAPDDTRAAVSGQASTPGPCIAPADQSG